MTVYKIATSTTAKTTTTTAKTTTTTQSSTITSGLCPDQTVCSNQGICIIIGQQFVCVCSEGYFGVMCELSCKFVWQKWTNIIKK